MRALFGEGGLSIGNVRDDFDNIVEDLRSDEFAALEDSLEKYISHNVISHLRINMVAKRPGRTSNNVESLNHVLKTNTDWTPRKLPELINIMSKIIDSQFQVSLQCQSETINW